MYAIKIVLALGMMCCTPALEAGRLGKWLRERKQKEIRTAAAEKLKKQRAEEAQKSGPAYYTFRARFDALMRRGIFLQKKSLSGRLKDRYETLAHLFALNARLLQSNTTQIPKIIHQIWLGSEPPAELLELSETVRECNPDFEYRLWRDSDIAEFNLQNDPAYRAAPNWGERADILRYHILRKYGGIYFDMDIVCLKSFNNLIKGVDFIVGMANVDTIELNNAVIASAPGHPILTALIEGIVPASSPQARNKTTIDRTGPQYITRIICSLAEQGITRGILPVPIPYFYPMPNTHHGIQKDDLFKRYVTQETYCIHLWEARWMKPGGFKN